MPWALNFYRTQDEYTDRGTLNCAGTRVVNIYVANAPIYYQFAPELEIRGEDWEQEVFLFRGFYFFGRNISRIRVRSGLPGIPAYVTIEALKSYEVA